MTVAVDLTLDGVALSTAVPEALVTLPTRPLVGRRRDEYVDVPGKAGSWRFPEEPGDRVLTFDIHLQGDTFEERRAAVEALADWADTATTVRLIVSDRPDRFHEVMLSDDADPAEWLTTATISLAFRAGPYALAIATSDETLAAIGSGVDSGSFSIPDEIDAEPIIEITPTDGTLESFAININGTTLTYAGPTIASGNTVTISTISDTVTAGTNGDTMLTGAYTGTVTMSGVSGIFPLLQPGNNTWTLTWEGTAGNITIEITWRRRYR